MLSAKQAASTARAVSNLFGRFEAENLPEVAQVARVLFVVLARRVGHLRHRLAVALVILITMLIGSWPRSLVRLVPMPNAVCARPWKRRAISIASGTESWSEKISVLVRGSTRLRR